MIICIFFVYCVLSQCFCCFFAEARRIRGGGGTGDQFLHFQSNFWEKKCLNNRVGAPFLTFTFYPTFSEILDPPLRSYKNPWLYAPFTTGSDSYIVFFFISVYARQLYRVLWQQRNKFPSIHMSSISLATANQMQRSQPTCVWLTSITMMTIITFYCGRRLCHSKTRTVI